MKEETVYSCLIRNQRKAGAICYDRLGNVIAVLAPGQETTLDSWTPDALYAPWAEVVFKADGTVETRANPLWPRPQGKWILAVENRDGRDCERRLIGGAEVVLPKGLPRLFELQVDDPLAIYFRMEIKSVLCRRPSVEWSGYTEFFDAVKDIYFDRDEKALEILAQELEKLETLADELVEKNDSM